LVRRLEEHPVCKKFCFSTQQDSASGGGYDYESAAIRPRYDLSASYVNMTGLLRCGLNKYIDQRDCG